VSLNKNNLKPTKHHSLSKVLICVLCATIIIFCSASIPFAHAATTKPAYVFNGATMTFNIDYPNTNYDGTLTYTISNVDETAKTYILTWSYGGNLANYYTGSSSSVSFTDSLPLAVSSTVLETLNNGQATGLFAGYSLIKGVSVTEPAGTFTTIQLSSSGTSYWVDQTSGIIVKETTASYTVDLQSTNIPTSAFPTLTVVVIVVVIVIVCVVLFILFKKGIFKKMNAGIKANPSANNTPPPPPTTSSEARYCSNCGTPNIEQNAKFCKKCGKELI
jgi:hypothetical protein